mgnify:CR=1 FL=1
MDGSNEQRGEVGYGRPPAEHRFVKGRSGNPKGRPRKPKGQLVHRPQTNSLDVGAQPANVLLIQEAYRPVTIREGDRVIELPAIQAVFRSMGVAAMKGNRFAQRTLAELVQNVEEQDRKTRAEYVDTAIKYKTDWEETIEWAREKGIKEPTPLPHPDDVVIDLRTATVHVNGPVTPEDKFHWDAKLQRRDEAQAEVTFYSGLHHAEENPERKERLLDDWHFEQRMFDMINDNLPRRYRKTLENRSWAAGASRPGSLKRRDWPGE